MASLVGVSLTICLLFSLVLPASFQQVQSTQFEARVTQLIDHLAESDVSVAHSALEQFAIQNQVAMEIYYGENLVMVHGADVLYDNIMITQDGLSVGAVQEKPAAEDATAYDIKIENREYEMRIYGGEMETVNAVEQVINRTIPWLLLCMVMLSGVIAWYVSKFIASPIKSLRNTTKQIANLDFNVPPNNGRRDELGELSKDIGMLAKELDGAMQKLHQELEAEKELEQKQRLFFAAASHELKTPLTIMRNKIEGMIYGYGEYENHDIYLPSTLKTATQMEHIINEILAVSQMKTLVLEKEKVNLNEIVETILEEYRELIQAKNLKMSIFLQESTLFVDENMMKKAIQNIISNAVAYSAERAEVKILLANGIFSVENFGVTVTQEQADQLCDPFYRIEQSRNRKMGGSGLGLHFVKNILDKHALDFTITPRTDSLLVQIHLDQNLRQS